MKKKYLKTVVISIVFLLLGVIYLADRGRERSLEVLGKNEASPSVSASLEEETEKAGLSVSGAEETDYLKEETTSFSGETRNPGEEAVRDGTDREEELIRVHVCGAVENSGVYSLMPDAIVQDAILAAGGVTKDAAGDYLNLADPVHDGDKIYVPALADTDDPFGQKRTERSDGEVSSITQGFNPAGENAGGNKVNINTADEKMLMTLTGIGQSKASSIIAYREAHGAFGKISDIMKVPGIKEAAYEKIKEKITV